MNSYHCNNNIKQYKLCQKKEECILSQCQMRDLWPEVQQAMLREIQTWINLRGFIRMPRHLGRRCRPA